MNAKVISRKSVFRKSVSMVMSAILVLPLSLGLFQAEPDRASAATPESTRFLQMYKQLRTQLAVTFLKKVSLIIPLKHL